MRDKVGPLRCMGILTAVVLANWCSSSCAAHSQRPQASYPPPLERQPTTSVQRSCPDEFPNVRGSEALEGSFASGELTRIPHPSGRHELLVLDDEQLGPPHQVFLSDAKTGEVVRLYGYRRTASFLWGPGRPSLAINDHGGSDYSTVVVFLLDPRLQCIDVLREISQQEVPCRKSILGNHHVYVEALRWLGSEQLLLRAKGYGDVDPDGFECCLAYSPPDRFVETTCAKESQ